MQEKQAEKQAKYWRESAERSWQVASSLFKIKHYDACLFFCHLAIEKLLKSMIIMETKKLAPFIHDLFTLARLANIKPSAQHSNFLKVITTFNIAGRYIDIKYNFYKKCTKGYTEKYYEISKEIFLWLKREYKKM